MDNFALGEILDLFKRALLWFIVKFVFTTNELRDEAFRHYNSGIIRIPGVCYGCNVLKGYQAIGRFFPERSRLIRFDYVLGFVKILVLAAFTFMVLFMLFRYLA